MTQYFAIARNEKHFGKGILKPKSLTIEELQEHLLNLGIVVQLVSRETYEGFNPDQVKLIDLGGNLERKEI